MELLEIMLEDYMIEYLEINSGEKIFCNLPISMPIDFWNGKIDGT